jgi:hypothetical protein
MTMSLDLERRLDEALFEISELEETIKEMDLQANFLGGFIEYLHKAGHWGYLKKYFVNYFDLLENRKNAASQALRSFILDMEGRNDLS